MKIGMLTGLWFVDEGATLMESLRRATVLAGRDLPALSDEGLRGPRWADDGSRERKS